MPERIPQSATVRVPLQAYLSADHVSAATGKTLAVTVSKNGGAYGNPSAGATNAVEIANGSYYVDLSATDTGTLGPLFVRATSAAADDVVTIYDVVNAHTGGADALPNTACTTNASLVTSGTGTDQVSVTAGRVDAGKVGGTTQTARDLGASVLLSAGTGAGQLDFTSGVVKGNVTQLLGTAWLTPGTAGTPDVNVRLWNALAAVALPLAPTVAGRTLDVSAGGEAGLDWANVGGPTTALALTGTTIATTQKVDVETIKTQAVAAAAGVTVLASVGTAAASTAQTGDAYAVVNDGTFGNAKLVRSTTPANTLDVAATGEAGLDFNNIKDATGAHTLTNVRVPNVTLADTVTTYTGDTPQTGDAFARVGAAGAGLTALGDARVANLDAAVSSRTKPADTQAAVTLVAATTNLTNLPAAPADWVTAAAVSAAAVTKIQAGLSTYAGGDTAGTTTLLSRVPGVVPVAADYTAARAAGLDRLDADVSSRLAAAGYTAPDNAGVGVASAVALRLDTALEADGPAYRFTANALGLAPTGGSAPTTAQIADGLLGRSIAGGADGGRTVAEALAASRNRVAFDLPGAGQFTVFAADDATPLWTGTYARGANTLGPLASVDPG